MEDCVFGFQLLAQRQPLHYWVRYNVGLCLKCNLSAFAFLCFTYKFLLSFVEDPSSLTTWDWVCVICRVGELDYQYGITHNVHLYHPRQKSDDSYDLAHRHEEPQHASRNSTSKPHPYGIMHCAGKHFGQLAKRGRKVDA